MDNDLVLLGGASDLGGERDEKRVSGRQRDMTRIGSFTRAVVWRPQAEEANRQKKMKGASLQTE